MKAASFDYSARRSVAEACEMLRRDGDDVKLIAGGQSLVPMMAMRLTRPRRLIDIDEIAALKFIAVEARRARTGACTRQCVDRARRRHSPRRCRSCAQALAWVGHVQTRNRGTVGGSLAHAGSGGGVAARRAGARRDDGRCAPTSGARTCRRPGFFTGPLTTAVGRDECLEEIQWPVWSGRRTGSAFIEVSRRHGDFAMVAACCANRAR